MFVFTIPVTPRQNRIFKSQERARRKRLVKLAGSHYANLSDDELDKLLVNGYEQVRDEIGRRKVLEFLANIQKCQRR